MSADTLPGGTASPDTTAGVGLGPVPPRSVRAGAAGIAGTASGAGARAARPDHEAGRGWRRGLTIAALVVCAVVFLYPFAWLVSASFKPRSQVFDNALIPRTFTLDNYVTIWQSAPMALWIANTLVVTVLATVAVTFTSAMVAWGFAYFRFRGRNLLFGLVLATMMLPGAVTMIPTFMIWNALGQSGTLTPLWAGNLFGSAFYVFLLRQFFLGLPRDTFDAATVDGAGNFRVFWSVALPLCKPALVVTALFEAQASWTDLMKPLIYLRDSATFTVPRGLKAMVDQFGFGGEFHWELIITASVITTVPMIILFFIGQRQFVEGIATTGAKG
ncbi:multiple sugar transport system permease protein [Curtobacterium sp. UNCCL20]|uniref:carbohydrate ABC transporter permease n=1 Tax=Curtobacterium sp. UNCCL20 TaxID=1502773 RepID=UPI00088A3BCE|nr:carbohydrate ABC transporter permease [Curtobacterium sp. UNCCL20]SDQ92618.1 multiple sugar transport system permease protein [Curtobacterium sp. UNCCL20]